MSRENVTMIEITEITEVMNYIEGLSAVVFDLDDTLYSEKEYVRSGYKAVAEIIPMFMPRFRIPFSISATPKYK